MPKKLQIHDQPLPINGSVTAEEIEARAHSRHAQRRAEEKNKTFRRRRIGAFVGTIGVVSGLAAAGALINKHNPSPNRSVTAREYVVHGNQQAWDIMHRAYPSGNANELSFQLVSHIPENNGGADTSIPGGDTVILSDDSKIGRKIQINQSEADHLPIVEQPSADHKASASEG